MAMGLTRFPDSSVVASDILLRGLACGIVQDLVRFRRRRGGAQALLVAFRKDGRPWCDPEIARHKDSLALRPPGADRRRCRAPWLQGCGDYPLGTNSKEVAGSIWRPWRDSCNRASGGKSRAPRAGSTAALQGRT